MVMMVVIVVVAMMMVVSEVLGGVWRVMDLGDRWWMG